MKRGSDWAIWDLHVHTPASLVHHYQGANDAEKWERFVTDLEALPIEFKALGVNDYIFIDGYRKLVEFKAAGRLGNIELLLPVIELRLDQFAGSDSKLSKVNAHVIFDPKLSADEIQTFFLAALSSKFSLLEHDPDGPWKSIATRESLQELGARLRAATPADRVENLPSDLELGFANLTVDFGDLQAILEHHQFYRKHLLALGKTEWSGLRWTKAPANKRDLVNSTHFLFSASSTPGESIASRERLRAEGVNARLLDCSDAHLALTPPTNEGLETATRGSRPIALSAASSSRFSNMENACTSEPSRLRWFDRTLRLIGTSPPSRLSRLSPWISPGLM